MLFHTSSIEITRLIAEAIGIELVEVPIKSQDDTGESKELKKALKQLDIDSIAIGGVSSNYQGRIFGDIAKELGVEFIAPYWNTPHEDLIKEAIDAGFEIVFTSVSADGFDESWLGRTLDNNALDDLKKLHGSHRIDIGGEGGEYCTTVLDGPIFKKRIKIVESEKTWSGMAGKLVIKKAELVEKE